MRQIHADLQLRRTLEFGELGIQQPNMQFYQLSWKIYPSNWALHSLKVAL